MRAVIGGIGYRMLCDYSVGIMLADELEPHAEPPDLLIEDLSYGPVAVAQWFFDEAQTAPITRAIFATAIPREDGRAPGAISAYHWDRALPSEDEIQRCVVDAVTGVIHLDNTLVVTEWMHALPNEVIVVEVEPLLHEFGESMTPAVAEAMNQVRELVMRLARDEAFGHTLPTRALGGGPAAIRSRTLAQ